MKRELLILMALILMASGVVAERKNGVLAGLKISTSGGASVLSTDTIQYHTILRDGQLYYWLQGPGTRFYGATRFTPRRSSGTIDSALIVVWAARPMNPSPTDTLYFCQDTSLSGSQIPGRRLQGQPWSFIAGQGGASLVKVRLSIAFNTQGNDFWAGYLGMQGASAGDSLRTCTDTTVTTSPGRQFFSEDGETWGRCDTVGILYDWGISLFANYLDGVELLTPNGPVSLPPKLYLASSHPFRTGGEIAYDSPKASRVELVLYDLSGRLVRILKVGESGAGRHTVRWDGMDSQKRMAAPGVYLCTLHAGAHNVTHSLVVVR